MEDLLPQKLPCFRCGVCCTRYQVCIKTSEAQELAAHLNMELGTFLREYTDPRWPGVTSFLLRHQNGACIFLERGKGTGLTVCRIHSFRPQDCRDWTPDTDRPECRQGLEKWGLHVNSSGEIQGTAEDMGKFRLFLETIREKNGTVHE